LYAAARYEKKKLANLVGLLEHLPSTPKPISTSLSASQNEIME